MTRRALVSIADLVLVTALLVPVSTTLWALLAGPVSAFAIWWLDGLGRERDVRQPQPSLRSTPPGTAPIAAESSASRA
jgi:hypothetical protein